jgi:hypothetical protein
MSVAQQKQIAAAALIELLDAELAKYLPLTVADLIVKLDTKEPLPVEPPPPAK